MILPGAGFEGKEGGGSPSSPIDQTKWNHCPNISGRGGGGQMELTKTYPPAYTIIKPFISGLAT